MLIKATTYKLFLIRETTTVQMRATDTASQPEEPNYDKVIKSGRRIERLKNLAMIRS